VRGTGALARRARLRPEGKRLGRHRKVSRAANVVHQLHGGPHPERAQVDNRPREHPQDRSARLQDRTLPADHEREGPLLGPRDAPGDRRIQHADTARRGGRSHGPDRLRVHGAHVDEDAPLPGPLQDPPGRKRHLPQGRGVRHHGDHDAARRRHLRRAPAHPDGAARGRREFLRLAPRSVVDRQGIAGPVQARRHGRPHEPQPHEPHRQPVRLCRHCSPLGSPRSGLDSPDEPPILREGRLRPAGLVPGRNHGPRCHPGRNAGQDAR
jgi:hypothetical protein